MQEKPYDHYEKYSKLNPRFNGYSNFSAGIDYLSLVTVFHGDEQAMELHMYTTPT